MGANKIDKEILVNKIKCPDGTILESRYQHDYQCHVQEDEREYFVDGGLQYQRVGSSDDEFTNLAVYSTDSHDKIRDNFVWGRSMDKNGKLLPEVEYIKLKNLTDDHVETLVYFTLHHNYPSKINKVFVDEHNYRIHNKGNK